jgi:phenylalanyl-tRNA synthetase beta chain
MKILKSWLTDYINIEMSDEELVACLDKTGTEVDAVISGVDEKVIVAEIKKIEKHPNADRLKLVTIFDGAKEQVVVCGAPNIEIGHKVPLAQVGANLPAGKLEKATIRGVESAGMLCAEDELGLGEDHSGIKILPEDYVNGEPLKKYIGGETMLELEITPNRGDCLSHIGVAREIAAFTSQGIKKEPVSIQMSSQNASEQVSVSIENKTACSQYLARIIKGVKIGPSPKWLRERIEACGAKSINNVVDITNYIMLDLGQPLHCFDYDKIEKKSIIVRNAKQNEKIVTLDGQERKLQTQTLVIADSKKPVAIAGIMGGANSEVSQNTTNILLEAAVFERKGIRKSTKDLGLVTEASYRFERGIDEGTVEYAINKASKMIADIASGKVMLGIVRDGSKPQKKSIEIRREKINQLLGLDLTNSNTEIILKQLGFDVNGDDVIIPLWRHDIETWQDLAEEVGRIYGYDKIPLCKVEKSREVPLSDYYAVEHIKDILSNIGATQVMNYPFLSDKDIVAAKLSATDLLEVANPVQPENKYLRNSLIPGLIKNVAKNPAFDPIIIFEIDHTFTKRSEKVNLAIAISGKNLESLRENVSVILENNFKLEKSFIKFNQLQREELVRFKIKKPSVLVTEIEVEKIVNKISQKERSLNIIKKHVHYRPLSKYPSATRDLAFIVDKKVKAQDLEETIYNTSEQINRVELFDEFASDKLGKGKKNLAFHIFMQDMKKTMTDSEADLVIKNIIQNIQKQYLAKLRD